VGNAVPARAALKGLASLSPPAATVTRSGALIRSAIRRSTDEIREQRENKDEGDQGHAHSPDPCEPGGDHK
jgi:hypothetical protein